MALVAPGGAADVPKLVAVKAESGGDCIELVFEAESLAQIIVPNDDSLGVTVINEVVGQLFVEGIIAGERLTISGRSTFEFLNG